MMKCGWLSINVDIVLITLRAFDQSLRAIGSFTKMCHPKIKKKLTYANDKGKKKLRAGLIVTAICFPHISKHSWVENSIFLSVPAAFCLG